jgi:hypothetical protein
MALKFDNFVGEWPKKYGGVIKMGKGVAPSSLTFAPKGSFKCTANNKVFVVIKESADEYVGYIKNLSYAGSTFMKAFTFKTAAEAKKLINIIAKK